MVKLFEVDDYFMHSVTVLFLLINFNLQIGTVYLFMAMIDWFAYYIAFDKSVFKIIPLERDKKKRFTSLIWAMGIYVAFIFGANIITAQFATTPQEFSSVFEYISSLIATTFSATPILFGSIYLRLAVWGLLIPIIESRFFFRTLLQWAVVKGAGAKLPSSPFTQKALMIEAVFGAIFAVFHIVAKGITNNQALVVTFLFGALSAGMVIYFRQLLEAIFIHVITNTIATMQQLRIGFFEAGAVGFTQSGIFILAGVLLTVWILLFQEIPFVRPRGVGA